jgi:hypothetical protein
MAVAFLDRGSSKMKRLASVIEDVNKWYHFDKKGGYQWSR